MRRGKIVQFPLIKFLSSVFSEVKKRKNDIERKKIDYLFDEAYRYYLDLYLVKTINDVDFPQFMYESGLIINRWAKEQALKVILEVIKDGRINQCYTKRIKQHREGIKRIK